MREILDAFLAVGATTCEIQLIYIWLFVLVIVYLILADCKKMIALVSLGSALYLGAWENMDAIAASLTLSPMLWLFYCIVGTVIALGLICTVSLQDN